MLKMKTSRELLSQVTKGHSVMPFHLNYLEDPKKARMGVVECVNHEVLQSYPVFCEKEGTLVAQFKFTVLMMPNGPLKITGQNIYNLCSQTMTLQNCSLSPHQNYSLVAYAGSRDFISI